MRGYKPDPDVESAISWADQRMEHIGGCITKHALRLLVGSLPPAGIRQVVEFGAGYSSLFLSKFFELRNISVRITSFEHQQPFFDSLEPHVRPFPDTRLIRCDLKQLSEQEYQALFSSRQPARDYLSMGRPVPRLLYSQTRLHNVFYDTDLLQQLQGEVDLVILDGPNGNGRSIAFPVVRGVLKAPFFCFVHDITHHPYMEQMSRVFDYDFVLLENSEHESYALVRIGRQEPVWPRSEENRGRSGGELC